MSKSNLSEKDKLILFGKAAGMCEFPGCGKRLYEDETTKSDLNFSNYAHIIGDSIGGPRGSEDLSEKLGKDINNIILLCPKHHKLIDSTEGVKQYTPDVLHKYKKEHEKRIHEITSIKQVEESAVIIYASNIGNIKCPISYDEANNTILPHHIPADKYPITISVRQSFSNERDKVFWSEELKNLTAMYDRFVKRKIDNGIFHHLSIFALAPMPLLVKLGSLITDITPADVYQLHREPHSWQWLKAKDNDIFKIIRPEQHENKKPVLIFSLSSNITERVLSYYNPDKISCWILTIDKPNNDYLKSQKQLSDFRTKNKINP